MENSDVPQYENMAEAAVENPAARFFCHRCTREVSPVLPEYTCPRCQSGFVEELAQNPEPNEESDEENYSFAQEGADGNEDPDATTQIAELWNMLNYMRTPDDQRSSSSSRTQEGHDGRYSRPGPSRRTRFSRIPPRRSQELETARTRTEGFLHQLVSTLSDTDLVSNASFPVFLNLHSNPGDYAWGRGGWNAIITQLINQLDGTGPPPLPEDKIKEIPTVNICQEQVDKNLQCTVCMEDFKLDEPVRRLSCDHHFHDNCIIPWLELHGTCPICRKLLNGNSSQENLFQSNRQNSSNDTEMMDTNSTTRGISLSDSETRNFHNYTDVYDFNEEFD